MKHIHTFESFLNEANETTDNTPFDEKEIEKGLEDRSKTSGIPVEILRVVMRRGMEKHSKSRSTPNRWNATEQEWGFARVDSFINKDKPTWGDADADLVKKLK